MELLVHLLLNKLQHYFNNTSTNNDDYIIIIIKIVIIMINIIIIIITIIIIKATYNNNNNNGSLTVNPPSGSSPVKNLQKKLNWNLQYKKQKYRTIKGYCIKNKNVIKISNSNTTLYAIYKLFTNVI